jgi:RimJ/RimL family protein N-acetyltransferase
VIVTLPVHWTVYVQSTWAFDYLPLERLQLSIHPANVASKRVADKAGFRYEGTLRSLELIRGERVDGCVYSLLRADLPG